MSFIHEIKNKRLSVGAIGSGTALSATTLYRLMFGEAVRDGNAQYLSNEEALVALTVSKTIDVAVIVAGQPAKLFVDMRQRRDSSSSCCASTTRRRDRPGTEEYFPAVIRSGATRRG